MRRQTIAIGAGRHTQGAAEMAAEMALVREAAFAGDIGDRPAGAEPIPRHIQALDQPKGMGWHANEAFEFAAERFTPQTVLPRQHRNGRAAPGHTSRQPCGFRGAKEICRAQLALQPCGDAPDVDIRQLFLRDPDDDRAMSGMRWRDIGIQALRSRVRLGQAAMRHAGRKQNRVPRGNVELTMGAGKMAAAAQHERQLILSVEMCAERRRKITLPEADFTALRAHTIAPGAGGRALVLYEG